jgi:hypothetical protein
MLRFGEPLVGRLLVQPRRQRLVLLHAVAVHEFLLRAEDELAHGLALRPSPRFPARVFPHRQRVGLCPPLPLSCC